MEFIDIIDLGNGKYIKRYWKEASGKKEIIEIDSGKTAYTDYLEKKAIKEFRESGYGDKPWNYDSTKKDKECKNVIHEIEMIVDETKRFQFNQQSNFLYHFVNKFTDTEITIEAIREELRSII